ncbi:MULTISPECIES: hypothetical protein [Pseudoalteromonas]|uniref:Orphan protein n=1 Tax=Pseudoalteromonas haloplanktis TaxID=228 RepID=A0ABU1B8M4_PSEHA|nr:MULTISPECIES: hypothetical protein [Pseudoalteromonas]MCF6146345.1 hypothetical protein [Pseudoalteromonas mariniglutinosa NCIMB 1770]MDQ9090294.1 hypothetical protein [Pseudoalteromonas haloplanktis]TMN71685.1 hypothetical protein CWB85_10105 [Pseudoalteromonas sp. S1727]
MTTPLVRLSFALQSFEDPLSAAMAHTMEYDTLQLNANAQHEITLLCVLPDDAHEGDVVSLSASHIEERDARYFMQYKLSQTDIEIGTVHLTLSHISQCDEGDEYVLQMMLHGLHATLKDSAEFDVIIQAFGAGYIEQYKPHLAAKSQSLRQLITSFSSSFLSLF